METIDRREGVHGELALRGGDGHYELISNGVFLMDTRDGRSERLLATAGSALATRPVRRVLVGGLGVGFTLAAASALPDVEEVLVVECEPAVVAWNRSHTGLVTGGSVDAPRVTCEVADLVEWLRRAPGDHGRWDLVCLDVDNGPDWVVGGSNSDLYGTGGLAALRAVLAPGGVLSVWSAAPAPELVGRLEAGWAEVSVHEVPVARGAPDVVICARRPASAQRPGRTWSAAR